MNLLTRHEDFKDKIRAIQRELNQREMDAAKNFQTLLARVESIRKEHQLLAAHTEQLRHRKVSCDTKLRNMLNTLKNSIWSKIWECSSNYECFRLIHSEIYEKQDILKIVSCIYVLNFFQLQYEMSLKSENPLLHSAVHQDSPGIFSTSGNFKLWNKHESSWVHRRNICLLPVHCGMW